MYAVIEVGSKQYRVSEGETIEVERLPLEVGESLTIDRVLLLGGDGQLKVGTPTVEEPRLRLGSRSMAKAGRSSSSSSRGIVLIKGSTAIARSTPA